MNSDLLLLLVGAITGIVVFIAFDKPHKPSSNKHEDLDHALWKRIGAYSDESEVKPHDGQEKSQTKP